MANEACAHDSDALEPGEASCVAGGKSTHLNLDNAWPAAALSMETLDLTAWGPPLRFSAPGRLIEKFHRKVQPALKPFTLYGSGDFHHLSALWLRRYTEPLVVVSFDNHPDWDRRPPQWACGGWVNRALELPHVQKVSVWGCGNFECWWPQQLFGNRRAEKSGRLEVHPWADDLPPRACQRRGAIVRSNWQERFSAFLKNLHGMPVYVTIDLDCLSADAAATNWESGRFTLEDLAWALGILRDAAPIRGGDLCGAYSRQQYARAGQRFVAWYDHPKLPSRDPAEIERTNQAAFARLWPLLAE